MSNRLGFLCLVVAMVVAAGCATDPSSVAVRSDVETTAPSLSEGPGVNCEPALTEAGGVGAEARATSGDEYEVWALIFNTWNLQYGGPVQIPAKREVKIVWRVTGVGELTLEATGPAGIVTVPDWGPEAHIDSTWHRPGDEWGTGWTFPEAGCWTLQIRRGGETATLDVDVFG